MARRSIVTPAVHPLSLASLNIGSLPGRLYACIGLACTHDLMTNRRQLTKLASMLAWLPVCFAMCSALEHHLSAVHAWTIVHELSMACLVAS